MDLPTTLIGYINDGVLSSKSPETLKKSQYCIQFFFDYLNRQFLPPDVSSLNYENVTAFFVYGLKERQWNRYTHWTNYIKLQAFFNWLVKRGYIQTNPLENVPKPKLPPRVPKGLPEQDVIELLRAVIKLPTQYFFIRVRNKAIIATFIFTGLRRAELLNLKVADVDIKNNCIFVAHGKMDKPREIPIEQSQLKPILEEYIEHRNRLGRADNYFFTGNWCGVKENNYMGYTVLDRLFRDLSRVMGKRIHAHGLRHTFATLLLEKSDDLFTVSKLMGHSDISTTAIYLNSTRKRKAEIIANLRLVPELK